MPEKEIRKIEDLVGEELSSVIFVQDYVQFDFNRPLITSFSDPVVESESGATKFPAHGSRDALCSLIGQSVIAVAVKDEIAITVRFPREVLRIPLDEASRKAGDAASFHSRPGGPGDYF